MAYTGKEPSVEDLLLADPGLPRNQPTQPFWQSVKHELGDHKSDRPPTQTDVVVIGSGVTGTSIVHHLLSDGQYKGHVTVFEARSLCSGATGRNGGNLLTYGALGYADLAESCGSDMALKVLDFTSQNVETFASVIARAAKEESQLRAVTRVHSYKDADAFEEAKASVEAYIELRPHSRSTYQVYSAQEAAEKFSIHGVVGAITYPGYAVWPYRAITSLWQSMLSSYPSRLSLETNTPVLSITHDAACSDERPYIVKTATGITRARTVVHATNGWTGHLLPRMRGLIFPYCETVTVQDLSEAKVPNQGHARSWAVVQRDALDARTERTVPGLLYLHQSAETGYFFYGGESNTVHEILCADDDRLNAESVDYLRDSLGELLGVEGPHMRSLNSWTGVQGMTSDYAPIVGCLPESLTGRGGEHEWIAAGYNGGGMAMCWLVGRAISEMLQGRSPPSELPEVFLLSEQRMEHSLTLPASVSRTSYLAK